jgi:hypothetical protein
MRYTSLALFTSLALAAGCGGEASNAEMLSASCATARIVEPTFPAQSVIVAVKDVVADYGADNTGETDVTETFRTALADVAALGGGTLWVPAGTYRFDQPLALPEGVTLQGDWKRPAGTDRSVLRNTIFAIRYTAGPFLTMTTNDGASGLTFWYPNQDLSAPAGTVIAFDRQGRKHASSITITNITFVNPAIGVQTVSTEDDTIANVFISNIYGAALDTVLVLAPTTGGGTQTETHLGARYWSDSGLPAPAYRDIAAYMRAHATGIEYRDNWRSYNITIDDFGTGILFDGRHKDDTVEGQRIVALEIHGARRAIDIADGNNFYVNNGVLDASEAAVYIDEALGRGSLLLNEVALSSGGIAIDNQSADFTVDVMNSEIAAWKGYAISAVGGHVIVAGSDFAHANTHDKDLWLGKSVSQVIVMSNTFADGFTLDSEPSATRKLWVNHEPLQLAGGIFGFASSGYGTQLSLPAQPKPARTGRNSLYDVTCYGAVPDCTSDDFDIETGAMTGDCTDNTQAFQRALDAAGQAGGGTVYVPASAFAAGDDKVGAYYMGGHLAVPAGVELTSADGNRLVGQPDTRTMLVVEGDGDPFITLAAHAGLRGITIWYANQDGYTPAPFGYAIQARGPGDWLVGVDLPNATYGADFATYGSDNHYIANFRSETYSNALWISKSSTGLVLDYGEKGGGGYDEGVVDFPTRKTMRDGHLVIANPPGDALDPDGSWVKGGDGYTDTNVGQIADVYKAGTGIRLGAAHDELIVDAYVHAPHFAIQAVADGSLGGPSFTLIEFGTETFTGLQLDALAASQSSDRPAVTVIDAEYHTIATNGYPAGGGPIPGTPYLVIGSAVPATTRIAIFTIANHSYTPIGFDLSGGDTVVQQIYSDLMHDFGDVEAAVRVRGGRTGFAAIGGKFINPLDPGVVIENIASGQDLPSPNVALAGVSLASPLSTSGPVDLSFQPPW